MDWSTFSEIDLEMVATAQILQRGREYYENGYLLQLCRLNQVLAGRILGNGCCYEARMSYETTVLSYSCTCPYPDFCKHLAAVALAWLEHPEVFWNADEAFHCLTATPTGQKQLLQHIVQLHPLDLMELINLESPKEEIAACEDGAFPKMTIKQYGLSRDDLSERLEGACRLLREHLHSGEEAALAACEDLLPAAAEQHCKSGNSAVLRVLELVELASSIYEEDKMRPLFKMLCQLYNDFNLWELQEILRDTLKKLIAQFPQLFTEYLIETELPEKYLQQISLYELLVVCEQTPIIRDFLLKLYATMEQTVVGSLWLIEKTMATNPEEAKRELRRKMSNAEGKDKFAFRERLIGLHASLGEAKQAAALSFLQFEDMPNFSEFQRLKNFLNSYPDDFENYYHRISDLLRERGEILLLLQIMLCCDDEDDLPKMLSENKEILSDYLLSAQTDFVADLISYLCRHINIDLIRSGIYEFLIKLMLPRYEKSSQNAVLNLCAEFKKYLKFVGELGLWQNFVAAIQPIIAERPDLQQRFNALLDI